MHAARLTVITPECIRLEYSESGRFVDEPTLFSLGHRSNVPEDLSARVVVQGDAPAVVDTGRIRLEYTPDGREFHAGNLAATVRDSGGRSVVWRPGDRAERNLGGPLRTLDGVRRAVPMGDGLLTRDGWFVLDDSSSAVLRDGWISPRASSGEGRGIDWYFFGYGRDYRAAFRALAAVAGRAPLPRRYLLGAWYSRYWPYTQEDYQRIVEEFDEHGCPLDVLVLDMDWHSEPPKGSGYPGWTGWSWNRELLPDAPGLLSWLHARGQHATLNLHPADSVRPFEDAYAAFMRALGRDSASQETAPFEAADRRYMDALGAQVLAPLERDGVDFWWMDWQQGEELRGVPGATMTPWLNRVFFERAWGKDGRDGSAQELRGAGFSRWGGWGDHRHPIHFSGDVASTWRALQFVVPFTIASGNAGCFYWSHDIGGHFGRRDEESMTRWSQFGALSAALRFHSARSAALDRRPWLCEPMFAEAIRKAMRLRSELMPSIYTAVRRCWDETLPLLSGMYIGEPADERAYRYTDQYMLGDHLLAAPIVSMGIGPRRVAARAVWFPPRTGGVEVERWYNLETGESFQAGTEAIVSAEIDEIPLFAPGGVPIVCGRPTLRMGSASLEALVVRVFPGAPGSIYDTALYEDDGLTRGYERGEHAWTPLRAAWGDGRVRLSIGPTTGRLDGQAAEREVEVVLGGVREVGAPGAMDTGRGVATVRLATGSIRKAIELDLTFTRAEPGDVSRRHRARRLAGAMGASAETSGCGIEALLALGRVGGPAHELVEIGLGIGVSRGDGGAWLIDSEGLIDGGEAVVEAIHVVGRETQSLGKDHMRVSPHGAVRLERAEAPPPEPPLGLRSSTVARVAFRKGGEEVAFDVPVAWRLTPVRAWRAVGPFAFDPQRRIDEQSHGPETEGWDRDRTYCGVDGADVRWHLAHGSDDWSGGRGWAVDLRRHFAGAFRMGYAATHLFSETEQRATMHIDSGDRAEVWVGEDKVLTMDTGDTMDSPTGSAEVVLRAGWNRVVVKVSEGGGGFGFTLTVDGERALQEGLDPA
ncbi:MAG: DUF5110 domain-containing protein [Phycisphaeraceae bacterium]|nr:DUF5110 domain-containing protein [Phycisphaeraceae bacterium]